MNQRDRYLCEQVFQRLDDYIDRELSSEEIRLIEEHLQICEWCFNTYQFQESVVAQMKTKIQQVSAPPDLLSRVLSALDRAEAD